MNRGITIHRYRLGDDPNPYPRAANEHTRGNHVIGLRIRRHMHVIRWWNQHDGH